MDNIRIVDGGVHEAAHHMRRDEAFLAAMERGLCEPLLCFYEWTGAAITYGYFIDPSKYLDLQAVRQLGITVAKRPTGGGILFHMNDLVFTLAIPSGHARYSNNILENYRWINEACTAAISHGATLAEDVMPSPSTPSFCMARTTIYDIVYNKKKIGGSAQRKTKWGYIHQASIFCKEPSYDIIEQVLLDKEMARQMQSNSSSIDHIAREELIRSISSALSASCRV